MRAIRYHGLNIRIFVTITPETEQSAERTDKRCRYYIWSCGHYSSRCLRYQVPSIFLIIIEVIKTIVMVDPWQKWPANPDCWIDSRTWCHLLQLIIDSICWEVTFLDVVFGLQRNLPNKIIATVRIRIALCLIVSFELVSHFSRITKLLLWRDWLLWLNNTVQYHQFYWSVLGCSFFHTSLNFSCMFLTPGEASIY